MEFILANNKRKNAKNTTMKASKKNITHKMEEIWSCVKFG